MFASSRIVSVDGWLPLGRRGGRPGFPMGRSIAGIRIDRSVESRVVSVYVEL